MRRACLVAVALLVFGPGCMGDDEGGESAAEGLHAFLVAVSDGDRAAALERLSASSSLPDADVDERVPLGVEVPAADDYVVLREGPVTVVATDLDTDFGAYGAPARSEQGVWKVEIPPDTLRLVEGPPVPKGELGPDQRVGFAVYSADPDLAATLWLDGKKQMLQGQGGPQFTRYWATPALDSGSHLAVALAQADGKRAAVAWTFTVGLTG